MKERENIVTTGKVQEVEASFRALIKSMVALAASDRIIDEREVKVIGAIFQDLTGELLDLDEVRAAAETFRDEHLSIEEMLTNIESDIHPEFKKTIIKACYLVGLADEILVKVELKDVHKIGDHLKLDRATVDQLITDIEKLVQAERPYH